MIASYYDENMNEIDMSGLVTTHLIPSSVPFINHWTGGEDGIVPVYAGATPQQRPINATIELIGYDYLDYNLLRDVLFGKFGSGIPFYVVDKRQPGKRFRVILESDFTPQRMNLINGTAVIPFMTDRIPYAESIGTTQDIQNNGIDANDELWSYGMGLITDDSSHIYTHTGTSFRIYNAGNVPVHPFEQELKITIDNIQGANEFLQLENRTTGDVFRVNEAVSNQEIVLDGANITSGGLAFLRSTNKQFITLNTGWNEFIITGASSARVSFDFPFYYR